jgi:hypothetical protein
MHPPELSSQDDGTVGIKIGPDCQKEARCDDLDAKSSQNKVSSAKLIFY